MINKQYVCNICGKDLKDANKLWHHVNRLTFCVSKESILEQIKQKDESLKQKDEALKQKDEILKQKDETLKRREAENEKAKHEVLLLQNEALKRDILLIQKENELLLARNQIDSSTLGRNNPEQFIEYLKKYELYDTFDNIFRGKEVCYKLVREFMKFAQTKRNVSPQTKKDIYFKQLFTCTKCPKQTKALQVDHIVPLYQGGNNLKVNLQGLCPTCHGEKTMQDWLDFYKNIQQTCYYLYFSNLV